MGGKRVPTNLPCGKEQRPWTLSKCWERAKSPCPSSRIALLRKSSFSSSELRVTRCVTAMNDTYFYCHHCHVPGHLYPATHSAQFPLSLALFLLALFLWCMEQRKGPSGARAGVVISQSVFVWDSPDSRDREGLSQLCVCSGTCAMPQSCILQLPWGQERLVQWLN